MRVVDGRSLITLATAAAMNSSMQIRPGPLPSSPHSAPPRLRRRKRRHVILLTSPLNRY